MDHRQLEESVAAYALGALDDADRREAEAALLEHLPGCESCRKMLADFREVAGDLALVAEPSTAPPEMEQRLIDTVRADEPPSPAVPIRPPRRRPGLRVAAVAAAAAIVALGAWNVQLTSRVNDAHRQSRIVVSALSLVGAPDAHASTLTGSDGTLVFVYRPGEAVLVGHDVSAPGKGKVLQLWLMRAGVPTSAGVFDPVDGVVALSVNVDPGVFDAVAVTEERGPDGATHPTGAPTYRGTLSA